MGLAEPLNHSITKTVQLTLLGGDLRSNRSFKMQKIKRIVLGMIDSKGFEQDNRVYYRGGWHPRKEQVTQQ